MANIPIFKASLDILHRRQHLLAPVATNYYYVYQYFQLLFTLRVSGRTELDVQYLYYKFTLSQMAVGRYHNAATPLVYHGEQQPQSGLY